MAIKPKESDRHLLWWWPQGLKQQEKTFSMSKLHSYCCCEIGEHKNRPLMLLWLLRRCIIINWSFSKRNQDLLWHLHQINNRISICIIRTWTDSLRSKPGMSGLWHKPCQICCVFIYLVCTAADIKNHICLFTHWRGLHRKLQKRNKKAQLMKQAMTLQKSHHLWEVLLKCCWSDWGLILMTGLTKQTCDFCWRLTHSHPVHESYAQNNPVLSTPQHFITIKTSKSTLVGLKYTLL